MASSAIGVGNFFTCNHEGYLSRHKIRDIRVTPEDRPVHILEQDNTGPLFIESWNYFDIPTHQKGVLVAVKDNNHNNVWRLGILNKMDANALTMYLLIWNGPCTRLFEKGKFRLYPSFWKMTMDQLSSGTCDDEIN